MPQRLGVQALPQGQHPTGRLCIANGPQHLHPEPLCGHLQNGDVFFHRDHRHAPLEAAEHGLARKSGSNRTRFEEGFDAAFHERVATGFRSLAAAEPARWRVLDASAEQGALAAEIAQIVHVALAAKR